MKLLSVLLFLVLLLATPVGPGAAQAPPTTPESESGEVAEEAELSEEEALEEFVPSEEVPADSAISFPVDI
jgi:hypothetical protein